MNKKIKELAEQAGLPYHGVDIERFAEFVRQDEREACAKLCESNIRFEFDAWDCAEAIRARDNNEQD